MMIILADIRDMQVRNGNLEVLVNNWLDDIVL